MRNNVEPPQKYFEPDNEEVPKDERSPMRKFWESEDKDHMFRWPPPNNTTHQVFEFEDPSKYIEWKKSLTEKKENSTTFVDEYKALPPITFKETFAVKAVRIPKYQYQHKEVEILSGLCYPHITALLGTYVYQTRLHILLYPAAWGDLGDWLKTICVEMQCPRNPSTLASDPSRGSDPAGDTGAFSEALKSENTNKSKSLESLPPMSKIDKVRQWFVCLSNALEHLHSHGVRHKDIKPENILIDHSGSALLTDFGFSRQFDPDESHTTNDQWAATLLYASPEVMNRRPRDDPSDVFSLGCVFMEMATVILGYDLTSFTKHRTTATTPTTWGQAPNAYYCNSLHEVSEWATKLQESDQPGKAAILYDSEERFDRDAMAQLDQQMISAIPHIVKMMNGDPKQRPATRDLWKCFQNVSSIKCKDCDPRLDASQRWKPTSVQSDRTKKVSEQLKSWYKGRDQGSSSKHLTVHSPPADRSSRLTVVSEESRQGFNNDSADRTQARQSLLLKGSQPYRSTGSARSRPQTPTSGEPHTSLSDHSIAPHTRTKDNLAKVHKPSRSSDSPRAGVVEEDAGGIDGRSSYFMITRPTSLVGSLELSTSARPPSDPSEAMEHKDHQPRELQAEQHRISNIGPLPKDVSGHEIVHSSNVNATRGSNVTQQKESRSAVALASRKPAEIASATEPLASNENNKIAKKISGDKEHILYDSIERRLSRIQGWQIARMSKGHILQRHELNRGTQNVRIFDERTEKYLFSVDLSKLGLVVKCKRFAGYYPEMYVIIKADSEKES